EAHRIANIAAAKAHRRLGVDTATPPIDIAGAIAAAEVPLFWRRLPRVLGLYINEQGSRPGILVNNALPHGARRHTAAHELGHHLLSHTTHVDDGSTVEVTLDEDDATEVPVRRRAGWPEQEKAAEAFAAWFLMPRRAVRSAMTRLRISDPTSALDVYRMSLLLGTSYRSTARHLPNLRLATHGQASSWLRVAPGRLKAQLDRGAEPPASRRGDVWLLDDGFNAFEILMFEDDRAVVPVPAGWTIDRPIWMVPVPKEDGNPTNVFECRPDVPETLGLIRCESIDLRERTQSFEQPVDAGQHWEISIRVLPRPQGPDTMQPIKNGLTPAK
nr:ImmA/IrrE family metallo-endopeptidase [Terriglobales bacterium]